MSSRRDDIIAECHRCLNAGFPLSGLWIEAVLNELGTEPTKAEEPPVVAPAPVSLPDDEPAISKRSRK